ncbi:MAG: HDOD domain-containing protein [Gammaproteobacteria bacterium]
MLAKLLQRFNRSPAEHAMPSVSPAEKPVESQDHPVDADDGHEICQEIEQSFTGLLLGVHSLDDSPMSSFEKSFLASAKKIYLGDDMPEALLPRLPMVVPRAMQALRDSNTDAGALSKILSSDIVLVAELIRLSNSAFYARGKNLSSIEDAIVNIGYKGIRQLVIGAAMKPILSATVGHLIKNSSRYLWDMSMRAGMLSDAAAEKMNENRFHAYLACMTAHTGMAVLIQHLDHFFDGREVPRSRAFIDLLNHYAAEVTMRVSQQWELPEDVISAQREQFTEESPYTMSALGKITRYSGKLIKIRTLKANGQLPAAVEVGSLRMNGRMEEVYAQLAEAHMSIA